MEKHTLVCLETTTNGEENASFRHHKWRHGFSGGLGSLIYLSISVPIIFCWSIKNHIMTSTWSNHFKPHFCWFSPQLFCFPIFPSPSSRPQWRCSTAAASSRHLWPRLDPGDARCPSRRNWPSRELARPVLALRQLPHWPITATKTYSCTLWCIYLLYIYCSWG